MNQTKSIHYSFFANLCFYYFRIATALHRFIMPLFILLTRFIVAKIYWYAGLAKLNSLAITIDLLRNTYLFFSISPQISAYFIIAAELICPVLLMLGLGSRFAALFLIAITIIINTINFSGSEHSFWIMLLSLIIIHGAGILSIDHFLARKIRKKYLA